MVMANMRPGSCAVQQITVTNVGLLPFTSYSLTTSPASAATMLWTDPANGLQLRIRRGSTVIYDGPLAVTGLSVGGQLQPGEPDLLEFGVCLPALAGNSAQGQTQTVTLTWTAIGG